MSWLSERAVERHTDKGVFFIEGHHSFFFSGGQSLARLLSTFFPIRVSSRMEELVDTWSVCLTGSDSKCDALSA